MDRNRISAWRSLVSHRPFLLAALTALLTAYAVMPACSRSRAEDTDAGFLAPAVPMSKDDCFKASVELDQLLLAAGTDCEKDSDCDCYNGGLMMRGCRWVAGKEPLSLLKKRESVLLAAGCVPQTSCPSFECRAACLPVRGHLRCVQRDGCEVMVDQFRQVLASAPNPAPCARDEECDTYAPGLANCGGVTDRATADKLGSIAKDFGTQRCPFAIQCGPRTAFHAACESGHCVERPGTTR